MSSHRQYVFATGRQEHRHVACAAPAILSARDFLETLFRARDGTRRIFGSSPLAFGHPGAGGSHAFADPENKISFAYVMNQMEQSLLPNQKSLRLVDAIYSEGRTSARPAR